MTASTRTHAERLRTPTSLLRWLLFVVGPALTAVLVVVNVLSGTARTLALGVVAAVTTVVLVRVARIETRVDRDGVSVRNPFRTVELRWDEVARADWIARGAAGHGLRPWGSDYRVRLTCRDDRRVTLTSTYAFRPGTAEGITAALRRTAAPAGVVVEPLRQEGPPPRHP